MIDRRWARILASLSLVAVAPMAAAGQALCDLAVRAGTTAPTTWPVPLDRSVTIRLTNTSLRDALDRVAAQARIRLFYSRDLLPSDRRVCIDYVGAPAGQVLVELLAGSDLEAVALGSDQVVVSRRATSAIRTADSVVRVQELAPVVVLGAHDDLATAGAASASVIQIDRADLVRGDFRTLGQILDLHLPGRPGGAAVASPLIARTTGIRGASSFGTSAPKIYIDGVEVADPTLTMVLDPELIERIEIVRGPQGAALHGSDALDGVVTITTRHEGAADAGISVGLRSTAGVAESRSASTSLFTQSHSLAVRAGSAPWSVSLALGGDESDSYVARAGVRQLATLGTGRFVGSRVVLGMTGRFAVIEATSRAPSASPVAGGNAPPGLELPLVAESMRQYTVGLSAEVLPSGDWRHTIVAGVDGYGFHGDAAVAGIRAEPGLSFGEESTGALRASIRASSVRRIVETDGVATTLTIGAEHTTLRERPLGGELEATASSTGLLSQLDVSLYETFFLAAGLRFERTGIGGAVVPLATLPMLGAAVVTERGGLTFKLRGGYGKGIRSPRARSIGRPARGPFSAMHSLPVFPEQQAGFEVGAGVSAGRLFALEVTHFDQLASGLLEAVAIPLPSGRVTYRTRNAGQIGNRGWEIEPSLVIGPLAVRGALTLTDSRVRAVASPYDGGLRPGDRMPGIPALTAAMTVGYDAGRTSASIGLSHARDWVASDSVATGVVTGSDLMAESRRVPYGFTQLRASIARDLGRGLTLVLTGDDLLDERSGSLDQDVLTPGRTLTAGLRVRF